MSAAPMVSPQESLAMARTRAAEAVAAARAAPLSRKKALLAVLLVDALADAHFAADGIPAGDILDYRSTLAMRHPVLGQIFALAAGHQTLVTEAVTVPLADYGGLSVEDFMVSLYNRNTVQRLRAVLPDGSRRDVHEVLSEGLAALA